MNDDASGDDVGADEKQPADEAKARRKRRPTVAEVFGDVLPDTTRDERAEPGSGPDRRDDEILRDKPPHHS